MTDLTNIIEKITKIVAKAESTSHESEAETFMARAHAMMLEYGVELADLGKLEEKDPVGYSMKAAEIDGASGRYAFDLMGALARYYGARIIGTKGRTTFRDIAIFGRESARATTLLMYPYVIRQVSRLARELFKTSGQYRSFEAARTSVAKHLQYRITQMMLDAEKRVEATGHGTALVPVDMVDALIGEVFPKVRKPKERSFDYDPRAAAAASSVSLDLQVAAKAAGNQKKITA